MKADRQASPLGSRLTAGLATMDAAMMVLAMWLALLFRFQTLYPEVVTIQQFREVFYPQLFPALLAIMLALFYFNGLYDFDSLFWGSGEFIRVFHSVNTSLLILILGNFALRLYSISRAWMLLSWGLSIVLVCAGRMAFRFFMRYLRRKGVLVEKALIIGDNEEACALLRRIVKDKDCGLVAVGYVADATSGSRCLADEHISYVGSPKHIRDIVTMYGASTLLIASSAVSHQDIAELLQRVRGLPVCSHISSGLFDILTPRVYVKEIAGVPMTTIKAISLTPGNLRTKRFFDLVTAVLGGLLLLPLWLVVAILIKATSRGPVLYTQERIGKDGEPFMMYKFRSMVCDADERLDDVAHLNHKNDGLHFKIKDDPRTTPIGRWIRKFSVDEFPQLINVFRGEMSLVGPRPPLPQEVERYETWHWRRLEVQPGMTGLWQISGRSDLSFDEVVRLDTYYIENWSVRFDLAILLRTIPAVLFPKGAY